MKYCVKKGGLKDFLTGGGKKSETGFELPDPEVTIIHNNKRCSVTRKHQEPNCCQYVSLTFPVLLTLVS